MASLKMTTSHESATSTFTFYPYSSVFSFNICIQQDSTPHDIDKLETGVKRGRALVHIYPMTFSYHDREASSNSWFLIAEF